MPGAIREFIDLMPHTVTIEPWSAQNAYGEPSFGAAVAYRARIAGKIRRIRSFGGEEVVSMHTVYIGGAPTVNPNDRVTLSTGYTGSTEADRLTPPLISVGRLADEGGQHHTVLYLA